MKAIIPAAGLGTRFLPATKCSPKELLPVLDKPVIQYVVEEALEPEGVDGVVIINSHEKPQIEAYFSVDEDFESMLRERGKEKEAARVHDASTLPVSFVYQDEARGLGHAVLQAAGAIDDDPFFVLLGDYFVPGRQMCVRDGRGLQGPWRCVRHRGRSRPRGPGEPIRHHRRRVRGLPAWH